MYNNNNNWLAKMNRKYGRYAIKNLMLYIVIGQAIVFGFDFILSSAGLSLSYQLFFSLPHIKAGQIWRLLSFVFLPPSSSLLFIAFALYFYWLIGSSLENEWGSFKFNVFYFTGIIGTMLGGLITQTATNMYINLSLFLAFAIIYPNFEILVFFLLPVKVKYIAIIYVVFLIFQLITSGFGGRVAILISILNILLFFGPEIIDQIRNWRRRMKWKRNYR